MGSEERRNHESLRDQLSSIERTLGEHTGILKGIEKENLKNSDSIRNLWKSQSAQDREITRLKTLSSFVGAFAGAVAAGAIGAIRWFVGK